MENNLVFIGDINAYNNPNNNGFQKRLERLINECKRCETLDLPAQHPQGSTTYMGIAIFNLALGYLLTKEDYMLKQAKRYIFTVLGYEKWGNAHLVNLDLSASWILWGLSLSYDWLKPYLQDDEKAKIIAKIEHHAEIIYDYAIKNRKNWAVNYCQNHNWINYNGLATAGYVLLKHHNKAEQYCSFALDNFKKVFELMPKDGSNYEGVTYWRYGGMWLFIYAHLLKERTGTDFFKVSDYLKNTFYYRAYQSGGNLALQIDFGDCHDRHSCHSAAVYYKVASEYNNGYAQTFGDIVLDDFLMQEATQSKVKPGILPEAGLELLFYNPNIKPKPLSELPKHMFFEDLGLVCVRTGFGNNEKAFSFKCSKPGGNLQWNSYWDKKYEGMELSLSHHHPDNLSYVFCKGENFFTREDGYNRNILPTHHSVLLVDGAYTDISDANDVYVKAILQREKENENYNIKEIYGGDCKEINLDCNLICYKAQNTGIYPPALNMQEVSRTLITDENLNFIIFLNNFESTTKHQYEIICNTEQMPVHVSPMHFTVAMADEKANYFLHSPQEISVRQYKQNVTAVMTTQEPDKVCKVEINTTATISKSPIAKQQFIEIIAMQNNCAITNNNAMLTIIANNDEIKLICKDDCKKHNITPKGNFGVQINNSEWRWL